MLRTLNGISTSRCVACCSCAFTVFWYTRLKAPSIAWQHFLLTCNPGHIHSLEALSFALWGFSFVICLCLSASLFQGSVSPSCSCFHAGLYLFLLQIDTAAFEGSIGKIDFVSIFVYCMQCCFQTNTTCTNILACTHKHAHAHARIHTHTYAHARKHTHTHTHTNTHTHIHTHTHTHTSLFIYVSCTLHLIIYLTHRHLTHRHYLLNSQTLFT